MAVLALAPTPRPAANLYSLSNVTVYDGDTLVDCDIDLGFNVTLRQQDVRLLGFDAAEVSRVRRGIVITEAEIALGKQARDELREMLVDGQPYLAPPPHGDKADPFGRQHGYLYVLIGDEWIDVAEWAKERGFAR